MSATNFNLKNIESCLEDSCEYYTHYPTFSNGKVVKPTTSGPSMSTLEEVRRVNNFLGRQQQQQQQVNDDIVISGTSGRFPESDNIEEFADNLYNGVDMVNENERRYQSVSNRLPKRNGTINRFDCEVFNVQAKQVDNLDSQTRSLVEVSYEAIFDSGNNPNKLRDTRTGVFIGANGLDAQTQRLSGCASSILANRVSNCLGLNGPSMVVDTRCSSSLVALDAAINAIRNGQCDCAIVGEVNILSCQSFDAQDQDYVQNKTVAAVFIQKKSLCKRFYAKVLHSKINTDGAKEQGITYPNGQMQARLLREIYSECNIDPSLVTYVEAHGTGTKVGDPQELNAIAEVFVPNKSQRETPLFVGSTKSNMGHSESASGMASLIKMLIAIQRGIIPANLHYQKPNSEVSALVDGRMTVVNKNTKFQGGLMALNSFGFGGSNAHILLQPNNDFNQLRNDSLWKQDLTQITQAPRLFQFCSRTEQGLEKVFDHMHENTFDLAKQVLLQSQTNSSPITHPYRGYTILNSSEQQQRKQQIKKCTTEKRPVFYIFSGMGSQYAGMGQDLMRIDTFRQSICKSAEVLKPYCIDLMDLIYAKQNVYTSPINSFVGIAAIQIALVDCLRQVGLEADGMIGHSVGELACAYADKCMTAEETLLCAYWRGKVIEDAQLPLGAMAVVGLSWTECQRRCPVGVVPACHNSSDSVTVSGSKAAVCEFVEQMKVEGIFAKEVDSSNVAFHSQHMVSLAPTLKMALERVITSPKKRSQKWISTSVPQSRYTTESACYSSADYHVNNFCSPVLFQEGLQQIPTNAICVEIAPHALLQAILRRSLSSEAVCIPLCKKDVPCQVEYFWSQLGQMYINGCNLNIIKLLVPQGYEQNMYPVPVRTGSLSHLVHWNHEQQWNVPSYKDFTLNNNIESKNMLNNTFTHIVDLNKSKDAYLTGHQIDGRVIYPAAGYLCLVWETFAQMEGKQMENCPIKFENVEIHNAKMLDIKDNNGQYRPVKFVCTISPATGSWEILEDQKCVASGRCVCVDTQLTTSPTLRTQSNLNNYRQTELLKKNEIYRDLALRGYEYKKEFQAIVKCNIEGTEGQIVFNGKWVPFLDAMLQMNVMNNKNGLMLPTRIRSITIDPKVHRQLINEIMYKSDERQQYFDQYFNQTRANFNQQHQYQQHQHQHQHQHQYQNQHQHQHQYQQQQQQQQQQKYIDEQTVTSFSVLPVFYDKFTNTTVCGGVEICGLRATWAPKRQWTQPTVLERVNFVPYVENQFDCEFNLLNMNETSSLCEHKIKNCNKCSYETIDTTSNEKRQMLEYYLDECRRYSAHIMSKIQNPTTCIQNIEATPEPKKWTNNQINVQCGELLELLKQCSNMDSTDGQYFYNVQKTFTNSCKYWKALEQDIVLNCMTKRVDYLKNFMDIVLENTYNKQQKIQTPMRILEISPSAGHFFASKIQKLMRAHPQVSNMEYHYISLNTVNCQEQEQDKEFLNQIENQLQYPLRRYKLNICSTNDLINFVSSLNLKDFDCVILNGVMSTLLPVCQSELELSNWLNRFVEKVMCPSGFALVHEYTKNLETIQQLKQLEQTIFRQSTPQTQKLMTEQNWRQIIEQSLLKPVSLKSDNVLSTMFLYRKPVCELRNQTPLSSSSVNIFEEKIWIDDCADYDWIERVKAALNKQECQRVWLISEKTPTSGIIGLVNCMRREIDGEKIRCIFMVDSKPIDMYTWLVPLNKTSSNVQKKNVRWTELFDQLRQADMVMNVFQSGKWGSFRHFLDCSNIDDFVITNERQFNDKCRYTNETCQTKPVEKIQKLEKMNQMIQKFGSHKNAYINCLTRDYSSSFNNKQSLSGNFRECLKEIFSRPSESINNIPTINTMQKIWFSPSKTYIVTGGLGGFGLELCQWMVERNARYIVLTSRSGIKTGYQTRKIREMRENFNATIVVSLDDVSNESQCINLFREAVDICPERQVGGIFHLAGIIEDTLFANRSLELYRNLKNEGTYNLEKCSRMNNYMDDSGLFVVWARNVAGYDNFGQGCVNSTIMRIFVQRMLNGKQPLNIQFVNSYDENDMIIDSVLENQTNIMPQRIQSCLRALELMLIKNKNSQECGIWSTYVPCERRQQNQQQIQQQQQQQQKSIVETVANILGLKDVSQWRNERITLGELGLDSLMSVEIKQILEQNYNLPLNTREIQQLTMEKLRSIEKSNINQQIDNFQLRRSNSFSSRNVQKLMPTKCIEKLNDVEYIPSQNIPVFVIHPIEGHTNMLKSWAQQMEYPVFGCQYTKECTRIESIEQLADYYWQQIDRELSKCGTTQMVHLCGYSFGASVAFEMAAKRNNRIASLTFLDGSPSYTNNQINCYRNKFQVDNLHETECEALFTFMQQYTNMHTREFILSELRRLPTLEQKVRFVVSELLSKSQFNFESEDLEQAARAYVKKLFISFKYTPKSLVRVRECLLIKSSQQPQMTRQTLGEDYGLNQVIIGKVRVETVQGDHQTFLQDQYASQVARQMVKFLKGF